MNRKNYNKNLYGVQIGLLAHEELDDFVAPLLQVEVDKEGPVEQPGPVLQQLQLRHEWIAVDVRSEACQVVLEKENLALIIILLKLIFLLFNK
jgi:hypothetical protein